MSNNGASASLIESFKKPVPSHSSKRNNACRQCRRRKLKCDGRRPCSTCLRSHAYLVNHPLPGIPPPPEYPECIYDNGTDDGVEDDKPEGYKKLENRISELESLLREMSMELQASNAALDQARPPSLTNSGGTQSNSHHSSPFTPADSPYAAHTSPPSDNSSQRTSLSPEIPPPSQISFDTVSMQDLSWLTGAQSTEPFPALASGIPSGIGDVVNGSMEDAANIFNGLDPATVFDGSFLDTTFEATHVGSQATINSTAVIDPSHGLYDFQEHAVIQTGWSPHLPDPATTRRLAEAFFAFHIHAGRLFHGPSFLASLDLHPLDERFPSVAVLHALCAVGSMYSSEIAPTPIHTHSSFPYVVFHGRWRRVAIRPDSFAEQHAKLANYAVNQLLESGEHIVSTLQAQVLLSWFYTAQARWSEAFMNSGSTLRNCVPLGLTTCAPFKIPGHGSEDGPIVQEPNILPESDNIIEQETRRNIFWLSYALERQCSISSAFAVELDDQDISQLLPVRGDQFELGIKVPIENRQFSNDHRVLLNHPSQQTDSFILFIKSAMLLSRVKAFNTRYKGRFHNGDPAMYSPTGVIPTSLEELDPRDTPAFQEIDQLITAWRKSIPSHMRQPVQDGIVDPHLYAAMIVSHLVSILLHDPFMNTDNPMCPSAAKVLNAARGILELMYLISSTSYDISLLDQWCLLSWYMSGRALIRFLNAAIRHNYVEHIVILHTEITFIHDMLGKAGERVPAAYRSKRLLMDVLVQTCGEQFADCPTSSSIIAYISPAESVLVDRTPSKNPFGNISCTGVSPPEQY